MTSFHVGQRVVCINDVFLDLNWCYVPNKPTKGCVYTVRGFHDELLFDGILLEEIINPLSDWMYIGKSEMSFPRDRFRPVKTTDISIFTKMLAPAPKEKEPA